MRRTLTILTAAALTLAIATLAGCGGDGGGTSPTPAPASSATPGASRQPTTEPSSRPGGIEGARAYLKETGLGGKKGDLTDPVDCAGLPDKGVKGDFCIIDGASVYAPGLVILFIADADKQTEKVWEVHLKPEGGTWKTTSVEEVPPGS